MQRFLGYTLLLPAPSLLTPPDHPSMAATVAQYRWLPEFLVAANCESVLEV